MDFGFFLLLKNAFFVCTADVFVSGEAGRQLHQGTALSLVRLSSILIRLDIRGRVLHARVARLFSSLCGNSLAVLCSEEYPSRVFLHV